MLTTIGHAILVAFGAAIGLFIAVLVVIGFFRLPAIATRARLRVGRRLEVLFGSLQLSIAAAVATNEDVVPVSALREAHQRIRELERLLGKKQMEIEILQAAQKVVKKSPWLRQGSGR